MARPKYKLPKTNQQLQRLAREWQARLRLRDWDISVFFADKEETKKAIGPAFGATRPAPGHKIAMVAIKRPEDIEPDVMGCPDIEVTLVHELLHLHGDAFDHFFIDKETKRPTEYFALEAMIELSAIAMVELKRGIPRQQW